MISFAPLFFAIVASSLVRSAPTPSLDAATLLKNGQDAQKLNAEFVDIKATDACTTGQIACIDGAQAACVDDKWNITRCSRGLQCFALPSVNEAGTIVSCTSERSALSIINATGAKGGIVSTDTSNSTIPLSTTDGANNTESSTSASASESSSAPLASASVSPNNTTPDNEQATVTVTVTASTTTLTPVTRTLSPDEASSLLASLTADGTFSVITILPSSSSSTSSASATTTALTSVSPGNNDAASQSQGTNTAAAASTIFLTAQSLPTPASGASSPAATSSAVASAGSSAPAFGSGY